MLESRSVSTQFPDSTVAIEDFSLARPSHRTTVLVGSSGCVQDHAAADGQPDGRAHVEPVPLIDTACTTDLIAMRGRVEGDEKVSASTAAKDFLQEKGLLRPSWPDRSAGSTSCRGADPRARVDVRFSGLTRG